MFMCLSFKVQGLEMIMVLMQSVLRFLNKYNCKARGLDMILFFS